MIGELYLEMKKLKCGETARDVSEFAERGAAEPLNNFFFVGFDSAKKSNGIAV